MPKKNGLYFWGGGAVVLALAAGIIAFATPRWRSHHALREADQLLRKGFFALAAEAVDPSRTHLHYTAEQCRVLLSSYYGARQLDRLEWSAEACLNSGIDIPECYIGLSAVRDMTGRTNEALQLLAGVTGKFDKVPDVYYSMFQILNREKKLPEATLTLMKAVERAGENHQLQLDALQFLVANGKWNEAKQVADRLKSVQTENPEVKLVLARVYAKIGDHDDAAYLVSAARDLIAKNPGARGKLQAAYADLLDQANAHPAPAAVARKPRASHSE